MLKISQVNCRFEWLLSIFFFVLPSLFNLSLAQTLCKTGLNDCYSSSNLNVVNGNTGLTFNPVKKLPFQGIHSTNSNREITPVMAEGLEIVRQSWNKNILDWQTSPFDLSFLNEPERPAGKRGFIKTKGEQLVFEDGTTAKFWGTNLAGYTLFETPKDLVKAQAKRLSALGFNLVRLHHHDAIWVNPNIFGSQKLNNTKAINEDSMEKIDWWIKCLKDEGIYVWLDLHVERVLKSGDNITAFDEISKGQPFTGVKGYNYVNRSIQNAMRDFNTAYLRHTNKYTSTKYIDEPAIAAVLITNENDLTHHYGNALLPNKNVPYHSKIFMSEAENFANKNGLSVNKITRTWEHGPSKLFLNNLEYQFNKDMIGHLRELGLKVPIITTSTWGGNPLSSLPALTSGDLIDIHVYQSYGALKKNPTIASNLTHWISAAQVIDKPISVSEWNAEPFPTADRHTLPLYVASQASQQGWDAMIQYSYAQEPLTNQGSPSNWNAYNDPSLLATMPAAALMYRRGDLKPAITTYVLDLGKNALFNQSITADNSVLIRTASEIGKLVIAMPSVSELPWLQKSNIPSIFKIFNNPNISLINSISKEAWSDTNEIKHNWHKGYLSINTSKTQAAVGEIGSEKITLNDVYILISTPNASIIVQSLNEAPINKSQEIIISLAAQSVTEVKGQMPFLSEPVLGNLTIKAPSGLQLYKHVAGQKKLKIPVFYQNGRYIITLDKSLHTYWMSLTNG
jgi:hypothetical protein